MNMDLAMVDYWASSGKSAWHRASAGAKLLLTGVIIGSAVFSYSLLFLAALYGGVWFLVLWARLPLGRVMVISIYPALFSLLFIVSRLDGTWTTPLVYLLRALTAGLMAIWLVGTTQYPDIFAPVSRVVPRLVGDTLFLSYRAFFTLVDKLSHLAAALRLRGGFGRAGLNRELRNLGAGLGTLVLFSVERSQRVYAVMAVRGHSGRVCGCRHWASGTRFDIVVILIALAVVASAVWSGGWRL
jgi:cobalt/nickel transport system permease protein